MRLASYLSLIRLGTFAGLIMLGFPALAQVTSRTDAVGKLLNEWHAEGTAAGLAAITYENRDGQHSALPAGLYPQLRVFKPDAKSGNPMGPAMMLRSEPTIGNCSMAAPAIQGGSLPRLYEMDPKGNRFLMMQYLANNLFVYPEHQDYDQGANGVGGYGDLYPVNTAATVITQGSSGSDQPFLKALLSTVAAFPPETQRLLIQKRILMPTLQSIFRHSNKQVNKPDDYFTGAAHPPVFDAANLDEEKMVRRAHAMSPEMIPPLVQIQVLKETEFEAGEDFFEDPKVHPHKLADTPVSIARVFRGNAAEYEVHISAAKTADLRGRPVRLRWQVLQGDPKLVSIATTGSDPSARIRMRWHAPLFAASGIRSHRIDIGVFADNGLSVSAPAFVSFYMLPNERRFFDAQGRVKEIVYEAHNPDLGLPTELKNERWLKVILAMAVKDGGLRSRLIQRLLSDDERQAMENAWLRLRKLQQQAEELRTASADDKRVPEARQKLEAELATVLDTRTPGDQGAPLQQVIRRCLTSIAEFVELYPSFQKELDTMATSSPKATARADVQATVKRLIDLGVLLELASGTVMPVNPYDRLPAAERYLLTGLNQTLLSQVLFPEALERSLAPAWVDPRLTTPKPWRDVYRYDEKTGALLGWRRHGSGKVALFDAEGRWLPQGLQHPEQAVPVTYEKNAAGHLEWKAALR